MKGSIGMLCKNVLQSMIKGLIKTIMLLVIVLAPPCLFIGTSLTTMLLEETDIASVREVFIIGVQESNDELSLQEQNYYFLMAFLMFFVIIEAVYRCVTYVIIYVFNFAGNCGLGGPVYSYLHGYTMLDSILSLLHGSMLVMLTLSIAYILL